MSLWESLTLQGAATQSSPNAGRPIKILVADDDPTLISLLDHMLSAQGDTVITAKDGFDAMDKFILEQPDLVLMDIDMPGMNGYEATRKIKALSATEKWVPVIMITAHREPEDYAQGLEVGADDYLTKPFSNSILTTKLKFMKRVLAIQSDLFTLKRFQSIFDHVLDGIVATNEHGLIVSFNHAAEKIFGYQAQEVLGRNVSILMPIPEAYRHDAYMARYEHSGQATVMGKGREIHGRRKDGSTFPLYVGLTEVEWAGARHFIGMVSDISERKQAERFQQELSHQLHHYRERNEEEKKITQELLRRIVRLDFLDDPLLQWHVRPSDTFSGDLIAAHRGQDGRLLVLVADGTGHGLAAAVSLLPMMGIFYTMADKNFELPGIIAEINKRLHETMPTGRFVSAIFIDLQQKQNLMTLWNGGMPDLLLRTDSGNCERLPSMHMPLGILSASEFDNHCQTHAWKESGHLIAMSDGVLEAENRHGQQLGQTTILEAAQHSAPLEAILATVDRHLAGALPHDDMSLAVIRLP